MKNIMDALMAIVLLALLFGVMAALPFILAFIVFAITGFIIYAWLHDARIKAEKDKKQCPTKK